MLRGSSRKNWKKIQKLISQLWSRWVKEYLPMLNTRSKCMDVSPHKDLLGRRC